MDPQPPSYEEAMSDKPAPSREKESATPLAPSSVDPEPQNLQLPSQSDTDDQCPVCRTGTLQQTYTCLGICLAIALFPCGIICCLKLTDRVCDNENCGATY